MSAGGIAVGIHPQLGSQSGSSAPPNPLLDGLVSWWTQDVDNEGVWPDSHGTNSLTATGTATSIPGHVNNCSHTTTGGNFLSVVSAALSPADASFTFAGWVNLSGTGFQGILGTADGTNGWALRVSFGTTFNFLWMKGGADKQISAGPITSATWFFVVMGYDADTLEVFYSVDGAAKTRSASAVGLGQHTTFQLHEPPITAGAGCDLDECAFWSRVLNDSEITDLWNAGAGISYNNL